MDRSFFRKMRVALTPSSCLLRTRLSNGAIVEGYNRAGYGGRGIYIHGDALEPELAALNVFLHPGDVFLDIGANVGVYTVKAAKQVREFGLVIAVEPFIDSAHQLANNVRANHYSNVRIRNLCLGKGTGATKFYLNRLKPNSFGMFQEGQADAVSVLCASLDDLCRWESIERLDYVKIDAEGAEGMILEGGMDTLQRFRPIIQVEITISEAVPPEDYLRFSAPAGINSLFIPAENKDAIRTAQELGWTEPSACGEEQLASLR